MYLVSFTDLIYRIPLLHFEKLDENNRRKGRQGVQDL